MGTMLETRQAQLPERGAAAAPLLRSRLDSIDLVRGIVIVLMALDHVKGTFINLSVDPVDLSNNKNALFFVTRWLTHFCAPVFVLLAGTGAFLYGARGRSAKDLSWFLLTRGLWLIVLELTVVRLGMTMNVDYGISFGQVIWAIGWSMVVLAGLVFLPTSAITTFGVAMIAFHNLFDGVVAKDWGNLDWLWKILHTGESIEVAQGHVFSPFYPLIPWIGVLAAGYGLGGLMLLERKQRRRELLGLGTALTLAFVALRYSNLYGDRPTTTAGTPGPWTVHDNWLFTIFSFVNCQKYPPSLLYLLMTLGPAIMALAIFDRENGPIGRFFVIYGRVPLFFYLLHWFVMKGLAIGLAYQRYGRADWLYGSSGGPRPDGYGYGLPIVYALWLTVVFLLFPLCYWFAGVKRRSRAAWLSYL